MTSSGSGTGWNWRFGTSRGAIQHLSYCNNKFIRVGRWLRAPPGLRLTAAAFGRCIVYFRNHRRLDFPALGPENDAIIPSAPSDPEKVFDETREGSVRDVHGTLLTEKKLAKDGYPGRRFRLTGIRNAFSDEEMFLAGHRFYFIKISNSTQTPSANITILRFFPFCGEATAVEISDPSSSPRRGNLIEIGNCHQPIGASQKIESESQYRSRKDFALRDCTTAYVHDATAAANDNHRGIRKNRQPFSLNLEAEMVTDIEPDSASDSKRKAREADICSTGNTCGTHAR